MIVARLARQRFASSVLVLAVASSIGGITGCAEDGACLCPTIYTEFTAWTATVTDSTRLRSRLVGSPEGWLMPSGTSGSHPRHPAAGLCVAPPVRPIYGIV
jgi:hypothetical protein